MMKRGENGVTLIELAVVMAIIAIMALFMAPAIGEWLGNFRIRQAARDIVSNLQFAKMRAISRRMEYRVCFDLATEEYLLEKNDGIWTQEGGVFHVPRDVDIASATGLGSPPRIEFNPDGTCSSGHVTIDNDKGKKFDIVVHYTGRIKIKEYLP
ncbi:MAG: GspH/FimT family pseudopilin [Desulfobacterales bacterium]|nr:GspH/FimT family pseudopilin [Desulfobacterales bacterium]